MKKIQFKYITYPGRKHKYSLNLSAIFENNDEKGTQSLP